MEFFSKRPSCRKNSLCFLDKIVSCSALASLPIDVTILLQPCQPSCRSGMANNGDKNFEAQTHKQHGCVCICVTLKNKRCSLNNNNNAKIKTLNKVIKEDAKHKTSYLGVMALIAIMELATESQSFRRIKQPLKSHPSNKIKVLF